MLGGRPRRSISGHTATEAATAPKRAGRKQDDWPVTRPPAKERIGHPRGVEVFPRLRLERAANPNRTAGSTAAR